MSARDRPENVNAYVEAHSAWMRFVYGQSWDSFGEKVVVDFEGFARIFESQLGEAHR
jgi:hypothetical protein